MLIVKREDFIKMPAGTIFAPYIPNVFAEGFEIKVDGGNGERYCGTMPLEPWIDDVVMTEGQYDVDYEIYDGDQNDIADYELIAVLEEKDVHALIAKLMWALNGCKDEPEEMSEEIDEPEHVSYKPEQMGRDK